MSNIFKIMGQGASQFTISKDLLEQFNIKYVAEFTPLAPIGNLTTGGAPAFIDNFDSKTFVVTATVNNYDPKLDIIEWTQVSGAPVLFTATNSLVTYVTTAASNPTSVVLQCTARRVSRAGVVDSTSDVINITASPVDISSSTVIRLSSTITKENILYNLSWIGSDDQTPEGDTDVILWEVPTTRKNYSYVGYKVQAFNKSFSQWYDVQSGSAQSDVGSYRITDDTLVYRYLPIWKRTYGAQVIGSSVPLLKAKITGTNGTSFGLFESVKPETNSYSTLSSSSVNRIAISIGSVSETDNLKQESIARTAFTEVSSNRHLNTLTEMSEIDLHDHKTIKLSSVVHSLDVTRTSGVSLGQLGN